MVKSSYAAQKGTTIFARHAAIHLPEEVALIVNAFGSNIFCNALTCYASELLWPCTCVMCTSFSQQVAPQA